MALTYPARRIWTNGLRLYAEVNVGTPHVARWITITYPLRNLDEAEALRLAFAITNQQQRAKEDPQQEELPWD